MQVLNTDMVRIRIKDKNQSKNTLVSLKPGVTVRAINQTRKTAQITYVRTEQLNLSS